METTSCIYTTPCGFCTKFDRQCIIGNKTDTPDRNISAIPDSENNYDEGIIEYIARMLGVNKYEEFRIVPTERAKQLGHKQNNNIYRFDTEFVRKGRDDGYSKWYGGNERELYLLALGLYKTQKCDF